MLIQIQEMQIIIFYHYRKDTIKIAKNISSDPISTGFSELVSSEPSFITLERNKRSLLHMDFGNHVTTDPGQNC
jgi:hypothetical protein